MVDARYRLMTEGLGVRHRRLVLGNSMGETQAWILACRYPKHGCGLADGLDADRDVGSQRMMRRRIIDSVRFVMILRIGAATTPRNPPQPGLMQVDMVEGGFQKLAARRYEAGAVAVFITAPGDGRGRPAYDFLTHLIVVISKACRQEQRCSSG